MRAGSFNRFVASIVAVVFVMITHTIIAQNPAPTPMGRALRERAREAREKAQETKRDDVDRLPRPSILDNTPRNAPATKPKPTKTPMSRDRTTTASRQRRSTSETTSTAARRNGTRVLAPKETPTPKATAAARASTSSRATPKPETKSETRDTDTDLRATTNTRASQSLVREAARLKSRAESRNASSQNPRSAARTNSDPRTRIDPTVAAVAKRMVDPTGSRRRRLDPYGLLALGGNPVSLFVTEIPRDAVASYLRAAHEAQRNRARRAVATLDDLDQERRINRERAVRNLAVMRAAARLAPLGDSSMLRLHSAAMRVTVQADSIPWNVDPQSQIAVSMAAIREGDSAKVDSSRTMSSQLSSKQIIGTLQPPTSAEVALRVGGPRRAITVASLDAAVALKQLILEARSPEPEVAAGLAQIDALIADWNRRKSLAQLRLPPPALDGPVPGMVGLPGPIPEEHANGRPRVTAPADERANKPAARGVEIMAAPRAKVHAVADGTVAFAGEVRGLGTAVIVEHDDGLFSVYANLAEASVAEAAKITRGESVGRLGETLPDGTRADTLFVHFEVRRGDSVVPLSELLGKADAIDAVLKP